MKLLAQGQEVAFRELYQRYGQRMYAFFYRMLRQHQGDAEDFTQELFIKILEQPGSFDPGRSFATWCYTLAHNMVKNEYRRRGRHPVPTVLNQKIQIDPVEHLDHAMDKAVRAEQLAKAVALLDEKHRAVFLLRYESNCSLREISAIVGCPEGTVKSRIHYAIKQLSQLLKNVSLV